MGEYDESAHQLVTKLARSDLGQALAAAEDLVARFPFERRAWASLAYVYEIMRDFGQALLAFEKAASIAPSEPVSHFDVGMVHIDLGAYKDAVQSFSTAIELSEKNNFSYYLSTSYFLRAYCFCKLGKFGEAADDLQLVDKDASWWIGKLRTKAELLEACQREFID